MPPTRPLQPKTFAGDFADPPRALTPLCLMPNWLTWKWQHSAKNNKWTKPPYRADNPDWHAKSDDPKTWSDRHTAVSVVLAGKADGLGFALHGIEIGAIDLDHCRDPETCAIDLWAREIIDAARGAYCEITVSGSGLRIIGIATGPEVSPRF
jgi:primase-polymerase (primpol)-like protein